jgi:hypothetical protein
MMYFEDSLRSYRSQDKVTCRKLMNRNVTEFAPILLIFGEIVSFTLVMGNGLKGV